jgi:hypothetical protein
LTRNIKEGLMIAPGRVTLFPREAMIRHGQNFLPVFVAHRHPRNPDNAVTGQSTQ